ncbi:MAG TPA: immunoglobulin domain-containing protein [Verrucomicrobiae bacterium]|nr:immunoglobulin domain-containing protein [Verrucomicrobiae bacterium]
MKLHIRSLVITALAAVASYYGASPSYGQTQLILDPTKGWIGYMNWFNLPSQGGAYVGGGVWGTAALRANYNSATQPYTSLILQPCTNVWETTDTYWVQADGISPNKQMDANYYVQNDTLEGQNLTFSGNCISNTFGGAYTSTVFIKEFNASYTVVNSAVATAVTGQPFSINLQTGVAGGTHIQYGFETIGPDCNPTNMPNLGVAIYQVQYPPIELSTPASQAAVQGQNVTFTETPTGNPPFTYQWLLNGTPLANSSHIAGAETNVLVITNVSSLDAGTYSVDVTNSIGSNATATAILTVIPLSQAETNYVIDPSFESDAFASVSSAGWFSYGGTAFANTNGFYSQFDPSLNPDVSVIDGSNCLVEFSGGANSYTGVFQDRPALPGQIYTASAWFFTPDATLGYPLVNSASANLQIQFYNSGGGLICDYESAPFTTNFPQDVWVNMPATNKYANNFTTLLSTGPLIVSPPGTASMRIQPGYHAPDAASGGDVYIDMVDVTLHETTPVATLNGSTFKLSFPTLYGPQYNVLYTTDLVKGPWQPLTSVVGDGTVKTVSDTVGPTDRYYIINTQP